jgi:hypothetical protein
MNGKVAIALHAGFGPKIGHIRENFEESSPLQKRITAFLLYWIS